MMKAALMYGPNDIRIEEMKRPACPEGGFVLKVCAIGLCGSDIRNLTTDSKKGRYPHVFGHEMVGMIDEISETTKNYKVGDRVYVHPGNHCLECEECRSGHSENCVNHESYTDRQGGFAEFAPVTKAQAEKDSVYKIPEDVSFERASLGEPLSSVYACQENIQVGFGDTVVIIGAGPIGCFHSRLAKLRGAKKVIMIEINDQRLEMTKQFGVDHTINSTKTDPVKEVKELTNGKGADKVISANPSTQTQAQSIFMARKGGIVVFFGGVAKGAMTELDTNYIHYHNLWIYGHYGANSMQVQRAFELAISDEFGADQFITHVLPLSMIKEAIELTRTGEAIKVVLFPNKEKEESTCQNN